MSGRTSLPVVGHSTLYGQELRIVFVHTPMATMKVDERQVFWRNFDMRYHANHPGLRHMRKTLWELPHWMTWLAGVLAHHGYTNLDTLDFYTSECSLTGVDTEKVIDTLRRHPGDVFLYSPMTPNLKFALEIADLVKVIHPDAINVFGGVVATPRRKQIAKHPSVDYVVFDRGEYALPELLSAIAQRHSHDDMAKIGNLCFEAAGGDVVESRHRYPYHPLDSLPFPKIDLFPEDAGLDIRYIRQVYALGCPYSCSFCTIQTINRKPQYFPIDRVLSEIRAYRAHYGEHHNIYFGDETFTLNRERTLALCSALESEGNVYYDCQTRLNCLTDASMMDALVRSGCRWVEIGLETLDQESQNLFKQRLKLNRLREHLRMLRGAGLPVCSFMVNGFPNQSTDDMRRSIDLCAELLHDGLLQATYLFGLVPYPGSDFYERPEHNGLVLHHHNYELYHEDMLPVYSTPHANPEQIYECFLYGVRVLGEAMAGPPSLGTLAGNAVFDEFGSFWQGSHV